VQQRGTPGGWRALYRAAVLWGFERFYHELAGTYDTVAWLVSRGLWWRWTLAALPHLRGHVLELGCGTGYVQRVLAERYQGGMVVAIDESRPMLRLTQRRAARVNIRVRLARARAQALPFGTGRFDTILATFPTDYLLHPATLAEIHRLLRRSDDARLVVVDAPAYLRHGWHERLVALAYWLLFQTRVLEEARDANGAAAQDAADEHTRHPYHKRLTAAGFRLQVFRTTVEHSRISVFVAQPERSAA
jgi:ubiquinone/menaquinone biosynthesis C-methylase UbiE